MTLRVPPARTTPRARVELALSLGARPQLVVELRRHVNINISVYLHKGGAEAECHARLSQLLNTATTVAVAQGHGEAPRPTPTPFQGPAASHPPTAHGGRDGEERI